MKKYLLALTFVAAGSVLAEPNDIDIIAADSMVSDTARVIVRIERVEEKLGRFVDTIDVSLQSTGHMAAGFDFKIATSNQYLTILEVLRGEIYDSCQWDYFSAKPLDRSTKPGYPPILWQVVGMAEGISNQEPARCFGLDRQASLVRLVVSSEHLIELVDTTTAIYFLWEDCTDNVVSSATGERLYLSTNVLDYFPVTDYSDAATFPTRRGAPKQCQKQGSQNPAQRRVEFHNGGIRFAVPEIPAQGGEVPPVSKPSQKATEPESTKVE